MCKCNKKHSQDLNHLRILALIEANTTGLNQAIYKTSQGYNFASLKNSEGFDVIEIISPDKN